MRTREASTMAREIAEHLLSLGRDRGDASAPRRADRSTGDIDYQQLVGRVGWLDGALRLYRAAARAVADQVALDEQDAPAADPAAEAAADEPASGDADRLIAFVRKAHRLLLEHPVAARRAYAALAHEGRAYAATREGAALRDRLVRSRRVRRAGLLWRSLTMGMLDEDDPGELPSTYLDNLLRVVDRPDLERLLGGLHLERPRR